MTQRPLHALRISSVAMALALTGACSDESTAATTGAKTSGEGGAGSGAGGDGAGDGSEDGAGGAGEPTTALDLLLVVDNSTSMGTKQAILADAMRAYVARIVESSPDVTLHVGIVSSSLGSGLGGACPPSAGRNSDDGGRLIARTTPGTDFNDASTYEGRGYFAYDPAAQLSPPGTSDPDLFLGELQRALQGVGEVGCGFEMPLEAMYTFLAAPAPLLPDRASVDQTVLDQRAAFLRDDSVLHVVLFSDENDASFRDDAIGDYGMEPDALMPLPRAECAIDPEDACCASCIDPIPEGCVGNGGCPDPGNPGNPGNFYAEDDAESVINLRAWESKRRFGIDFLYPVGRYVEALSSPTLEGGPNPIFANGSGARRVLFTAVVGVPWQDVAADAADVSRGFQTSGELQTRGTWDVILGSPESNVLPGDPHMIETPWERAGLSTAPGSSAINGNEWDTSYVDLQYACVFDLPPEAQGVCDSDLIDPACIECSGETPDKPICDPSDPLRTVRAKAYPGRRELAVAEALGARANVLPMCGLFGESGPEPAVSYVLRTGFAQTADQVAALMQGGAPPRQAP